MKIQKSIRLLLITFILILSTLLPGCSSDHMIIIFKDPFKLNLNNLTSIIVLPDDSSVPLGTSLQYSAKGHFKDGSTFDITDLVK